MTVTLREITMDNFIECIKLGVGETQKSYVASNMFSLAEAKADKVSNRSPSTPTSRWSASSCTTTTSESDEATFHG